VKNILCEILKGYQRALFLEKGFTPNPKKKGEAPMKVDISVPNVVSIFEEHQAQLEKFFEMIGIDIRQSIGGYLVKLMEMKRTRFLGRELYRRG
jgi:hypothetical protein